MATKQLTLPGEIVKKDNKLVRSRVSIAGVDASRILANLIACIHTNDNELTETYLVAVKDFLNVPGGGNYARVKEICRELAKATAEMEEPDPDGPHPVFTVIPFFFKIKYRRGIVEARFNPEMSPMLIQLRGLFTEYNLLEYLSLPSAYSQKLFEILKSWDDKPEIIIPVSKLHKMLDTPKSFQNNFAQFRKWVLEKAHADITEKTSLRFEWEPIKAGRSVEKILFTFGPGRRAIAEAEKKKAKEDKQRRLQTQRFIRAVDCAKAKNGDCRTMDNKPIVCKLCQKKRICASMRSGNRV